MPLSNSKPQQSRSLEEKRAIVTLAIGEQAKAMVDIGRPFLEYYANKVEADIIVIDEEVFSTQFPHMEKFQIAKILDNYDRVLYLDADTIINPECPDIFNIVPVNTVGAVSDCSDGGWYNLNRFQEIAEVQRKLGGINWSSGYFNSGVLVISKEHKELFGDPFERFKFESGFRDQTLINYNLQKLGFDFFLLDKKFNGMSINGFTSLSEDGVQNKLRAYICHFAHEFDIIVNMKRVADYLKEKYKI
jgi:lipopolysaccharide biosynthesis glycosyltransferase